MYPVQHSSRMSSVPESSSICSNTTKKVSLLATSILLAGIGLQFGNPFALVTGLLLGIGGLAVHFAAPSPQPLPEASSRTLQSDLQEMQKKDICCKGRKICEGR